MPSYEYAIDAAVTSLQEYLKKEIPKIRNISREWPNPSYKFKPPELSIISSLHQITPARPYVVGQVQVKNIARYKYNFLVGYVDFNLQVDLWTDNKEERQDLMQKISEVFNPEIDRSSGLSLVMDDYHDRRCRFEIDSTNIDDNDDSAIRSEWRYRIMVRCHTDLIVSKLYSSIGDIDVTLALEGVKGNPLSEDRTFPIRSREYLDAQVRADTVPIVAGSISKAVTFNSPMPNATYGIRAVLLNDNEDNPQIQEVVITSLSQAGFTALWPAATDSHNYVLSYVAQAVDAMSDKAGQFTLSNGVNSAVVTIPSISGIYAVVPQLINTVDTNPQIMPMIITAKAATSFSVLFSGSLDSANYKLGWIAVKAQSKFGEQGVDSLQAQEVVNKVNYARFTANFGIALAFENLVDANPQIHLGTVTLKNDQNFSVESQEPDSANYKVNYILRES